MTTARSARDMFSAISRGAKVKNLYKGDCKGCGQCCSRFIPVTGLDIARLRSYVREHGIEQEPERADVDLVCPYLDGYGECKVYDARPEVCRAYRCDKHLDGTLPAMPGVDEMVVLDLREVVR